MTSAFLQEFTKRQPGDSFFVKRGDGRNVVTNLQSALPGNFKPSSVEFQPKMNIIASFAPSSAVIQQPSINPLAA